MMEEPQSDVHMVLCTCSTDQAKSLAEALVREKLAACVNILPSIRSIYSWQGDICDDQESLLICKTPAPILNRLIDRIQTLHAYDVPEVLAIPVAQGLPAYLKWVADTTRPE